MTCGLGVLALAQIMPIPYFGLGYVAAGLLLGCGTFPAAALAGLALLGAIATNISVAMGKESQRDAALITFLATASGMQFLGLSSVFWGICIGLVAHFVLSQKDRNAVLLAASDSK